MKSVLLVLALPLLLGAGPCAQSEPVSGTMKGEGTIQQGVGPECPTIWCIVTADGEKYWPIEDPTFHRGGLRVRFSVRPRSDMASICMAGTIIEVISIEEIH